MVGINPINQHKMKELPPLLAENSGGYELHDPLRNRMSKVIIIEKEISCENQAKGNPHNCKGKSIAKITQKKVWKIV
jgi:hypothetical protein